MPLYYHGAFFIECLEGCSLYKLLSSEVINSYFLGTNLVDTEEFNFPFKVLCVNRIFAFFPSSFLSDIRIEQGLLKGGIRRHRASFVTVMGEGDRWESLFLNPFFYIN